MQGNRQHTPKPRTFGANKMRFEINNISKRLIEITIDETNSGVLNKNEAKALAIHLILVASELLDLEQTK